MVIAYELTSLTGVFRCAIFRWFFWSSDFQMPLKIPGLWWEAMIACYVVWRLLHSSTRGAPEEWQLLLTNWKRGSEVSYASEPLIWEATMKECLKAICK